jgi:hypothetical protein
MSVAYCIISLSLFWCARFCATFRSSWRPAVAKGALIRRLSTGRVQPAQAGVDKTLTGHTRPLDLESPVVSVRCRELYQALPGQDRKFSTPKWPPESCRSNSRCSDIPIGREISPAVSGEESEPVSRQLLFPLERLPKRRWMTHWHPPAPMSSIRSPFHPSPRGAHRPPLPWP